MSAILNIPLDDIERLPEGAKFTATEGNSTVTLSKTGEGIRIESVCDSLHILVKTLEKELYRERREKSELNDQLKEKTVQIVKEPTGFQWFQIWGFWILLTTYILKYLNSKYKLIKWL